MKFLDFGYWENNVSHKIEISDSFKKAAIRQIGKQLMRMFQGKINLNLSYITFDKFIFNDESYKDKLPKPTSVKGVFKVDKFTIGYGGGAMAFFGELIIRNTNYDEGDDELPLDEEIQIDEYIFNFEFYESSYKSLSDLIEAINKQKKISVFTDYPFFVKFYYPGIDCEIKVKFEEKQSKDSKALFISIVSEAIEAFNAANESGENSKGLIHNVVNIKSEKTNSDNLTFVVDLGSAGEEGLKVFFKAFEDTQIPIEIVEVK